MNFCLCSSSWRGHIITFSFKFWCALATCWFDNVRIFENSEKKIDIESQCFHSFFKSILVKCKFREKVPYVLNKRKQINSLENALVFDRLLYSKTNLEKGPKIVSTTKIAPVVNRRPSNDVWGVREYSWKESLSERDHQ